MTEFIPVSSTGHLILAGALVSFTGEKAKLFEVFIQLGAILAVVWIYRQKILDVTVKCANDAAARAFAANIAVAFLPAAIIGFFIHGAIKRYLFNPLTVAFALVAGGVAIIIIENMKHRGAYADTDSVGIRAALWVGMAQILSLFPGVSRSGATIMGGMLAGMTRKTATEFSFFLAIPTMFAATVYDLYKSRGMLEISDGVVLAVGFASAFISAIWVVKWLIRFVSQNSFKPFAYYRIAFGGVLLVYYLILR